MSLSEYKTALETLVPGEHPLASGALGSIQELAIGSALDEHSGHRPRKVVEDSSGDGGFDYPLLTTLTSWDEDFSKILEVEYPVDDTDETPDVLGEEDWTIYEKPSGKQLRFLNDEPEATESFRVSYTAYHTITSNACSVPTPDRRAVQTLAASFYCRRLSAAYTHNQDANISADSVDHASKRQEFAALAREFRQEYLNHMGIKDGKPKPASHNQDQDVVYPHGRDRLTHGRRFR